MEEKMMESREPLYFQIKRELLARIDSGEWGPGAQLPTEPELEEEFGASRGTVRRALSELSFEGRIHRRSGKGTFVAKLPPRTQSQEIVSFTEQVRQRGHTPSTQVLEAEQLPASEVDSQVRQAFALSMDDQVIRIQRLRLGNGHPLSLQTVYLQPDSCPGILENDLGQLMPLYEACGKRITYADETFRIEYVNSEEAALLDVTSGDAVVMRFRVSYLADGQPFEVLHSQDRADTFEFRHRLVPRRG